MLDDGDRLMIVPAALVDAAYASGLFAVYKNLTRDRLIMGSRPPNVRESTLRRWLGSLALSSCLLNLYLPPGRVWALYADDLIDYFYAFAVSDERARRNALRGRWPQRLFRGFKAYDPTISEDELVNVCVRTMPMGDSNAPEFGQAAHRGLGLTSGAIAIDRLLCLQGAPPPATSSPVSSTMITAAWRVR